MKYYISTTSIALLLILVFSCSVDYFNNNSSISRICSPIFTSSIETAKTRTFVDKDLYMYWTDSDCISIFTSTYNEQYRFDGQTGANGGSFSKVSTGQFVSGNSISKNFGVYPYNPSTVLTKEECLELELPAIQEYATNTFGIKANTMVAVTRDTDDYFLPFKNVCGYLVIKLYGEEIVKQIVLEGNNGEKIAGAATIIADHGSVPIVTMKKEASTRITINCGDGIELGKTADTATEFWFVIPPTTFEYGFTIRITDGGLMEMKRCTSSRRTIQRNVVNYMTALETKYSELPMPVPDMVDLGLSVRWASFNLGASKPEEYGNHYAWGETVTKSDYSWQSYKWCEGSTYNTLTKYCDNYTYGIIDNKKILVKADDVAYQKLGDKWRIPTQKEWHDMLDNCLWEWTNYNGVNGIKLTSKINGNSIFLPAAGHVIDDSYNGVRGFYSPSDRIEGFPSNIMCIDFTSQYIHFNQSYRYLPYSIRPVYDYSAISAKGISLDFEELTFTKIKATATLIATVLPSEATNKKVIWASSNTDVAKVSQEGLVTAWRNGTAIITATTEDGVYTATCTVRVEAI